MKSEKFDYIFFSPHFDDVVFSSGGLISQMKGSKSILVVTVFSGVGDGFPSKVGMNFALECGYENVRELFNIRKCEEKKVAKLLGYKMCLMGYPDAIFRCKKSIMGKKHLYNDRDQIFGNIGKNDEVIKDMGERISLLTNKYSKANTKIYFPLGLGGHVDHKVVSGIGRNFITTKNKYFYEDFPYVINEEGDHSNSMELVKVFTSKEVLEKKYEAMSVYKSQIKGLFKSDNDLKKQLVNFYMKRGEHYWHPMIKISVLLATINRPNSVETCLKSILMNEGDDWEVLVLDQSSDQETKKVVERFRSKKIKYVLLNNPGRARAINEGIKLSQGEILAFTDDDVIVTNDWLKKIKEIFKDTELDVVYGKTLAYQPTKKIGSGCASVSPISWNKKVVLSMDNLFCSEYFGLGSNMAVRRINFEKFGNFAEWLGVGAVAGGGEDWELAYWLIKNRRKVVLEPRIVVYHDRWLSEFQLMRLLVRYAIGTSSFLIYLLFSTRDVRFGKNWWYFMEEYYKNVWKTWKYLGVGWWLALLVTLTEKWFLGVWLGMIMSVLDNKKLRIYSRE